jgi:transketolase N-terminal domain/subunit
MSRSVVFGSMDEKRCLRKETLRTRRENESRIAGGPERPKCDISETGGGGGGASGG